MTGIFLWMLLVASSTILIAGFQGPTVAVQPRISIGVREKQLATRCFLAKEESGEYSRELLLREEAESPFRKVRFFLYGSVGAGAFVSLLLSVTRIAAALAGINSDLLQESAVNAGIDALGLIVLAFLWRNDLSAQESRLKRASKGAALAKLQVRGSKQLMEGYLEEESQRESSDTFTTSLASLRRGRGIEKRVVIAAAGKEKISAVLGKVAELKEALAFNDLLVVPVELPRITAPEVSLDDLSPCVALPVGRSWNVVVGDEVEQAVEQGLDVENEGFCVILKKNGRVGQRTKGIFLENMVSEVTMRREAGMDVKNI